MNEQEILVNEQTEQVNDNQYYIDAIKEIQANSVSKERYNKLLDENKYLVDSLVKGESLAPANSAPQEVRTLKDIMNDQKDCAAKGNQCGYIEYALEFRDKLLEETGEDCFVSRGANVTPTEESYRNAQKVADIYKECLDYANGDDKALINELQRRMVESPIANMRNTNQTYRR